MILVKAKNNMNKLEVFNNRPFSVDIHFMGEDGFIAYFRDITNGEKMKAVYRNMEDFYKEWEFCRNISYPRVNYEVINKYEE